MESVLELASALRMDRAPSRSAIHPPIHGSTHDSGGSNVRVIARFRPLNTAEQDSTPVISFKSNAQCQFRLGEVVHDFSFDRVFGPESSQDEIFEYSLKQTVEDVLKGYNGTVLAYGQTGAGKSHTMMGPSISGPQRGVIPRIIEEIFHNVEQLSAVTRFTVNVSYMEVYNERVKDLMYPQNDNLPVHEARPTNSSNQIPLTSLGGQNHKRSASQLNGASTAGLAGFYVKGLSSTEVASAAGVYEVIDRGIRHRAVAATNMNNESSRSHSILSLTIMQKDKSSGELRRGQLFLVDLAGSEKVSKTGAVGQVLEEAKSINKSLSTLGMVINALTDAKIGHVPYRDSKLTRILQESLGGNSRTSLIVNCSLSAIQASETLSTLRFGTRAKAIKNKAHINAEYDSLTAQLKTQNLHYQALLEQARIELSKWRTGDQVPECDWTEIALTSPSATAAFAYPSRRPSSAMSSISYRRLSRAPAALESDIEEETLCSPARSSSQLGGLEQTTADRLQELQAQMARRESEAVASLQREITARDEQVAQLQADLDAAQIELADTKRLAERRLADRAKHMARRMLNELTTERRQVLDENHSLRRADELSREILRKRDDHIRDIEAQLADKERRLAEQEALLYDRMEALRPRIAKSTNNIASLAPLE